MNDGIKTWEDQKQALAYAITRLTTHCTCPSWVTDPAVRAEYRADYNQTMETIRYLQGWRPSSNILNQWGF